MNAYSTRAAPRCLLLAPRTRVSVLRGGIEDVSSNEHHDFAQLAQIVHPATRMVDVRETEMDAGIPG